VVVFAYRDPFALTVVLSSDTGQRFRPSLQNRLLVDKLLYLVCMLTELSKRSHLYLAHSLR